MTDITTIKRQLDMLISNYDFEYNEEKGLVKITKYELLYSLMNQSIAHWIAIKDVYVTRVYELLSSYNLECIVCIADFMSDVVLLSSANGLVLKDFFDIE